MFHAVIVAAGTGVRLDSVVPKQYLPILGKPILVHTMNVFDRFSCLQEIVVVINPGHESLFVNSILEQYRFTKRVRFVHGGASRQASVEQGLNSLPETGNDFVFIHDGVRLFVNDDILERCADAVQIHEAACCAVPCVDTLKITQDGKTIAHSLARHMVWRAQTPQVFRLALIREAIKKAKEDHFVGTDDSQLVERIGKPVYLVTGSEDNFKVTTAGDFLRAEELIRWRST